MIAISTDNMKFRRWMTIFQQNLSILLFFAIVFFLAAAMVFLLPLLKSESEVGLSLEQIAPVALEKALYAGDDLLISFTCNSPSVDRWMIRLTTTANPENIGYMTLRLEGVGEKTMRTGIFNKISGTYSIPLNNEISLTRQRNMVLHITLKGGNEKEPLIYLAEMEKGNTTAYQVDLRPEKGYSVAVPKNAVYPWSVTDYRPSGECTID